MWALLLINKNNKQINNSYNSKLHRTLTTATIAEYYAVLLCKTLHFLSMTRDTLVHKIPMTVNCCNIVG